MKPGQDKIYYILANSKEMCENSPYMEPFRGTEIPILYLTLHVDEMVFRGMQKYKNFNFINIETNYEDFAKDIKQTEHDKVKGIPEEDLTTFCLWTKNELQPVVSKVQVSKRLTDSPAIIVSQWSSGMRQVLTMMDRGQGMDVNKNLTFEVNPNHELIIKLNTLRKANPQFASTLMKQLLDNTMLTAGVQTDLKQFVNRINKIMVHTMDQEGTVNRITEGQAAHREEISHTTATVEDGESVIDQANKSEREKVHDAEVVLDPSGKPILRKSTKGPKKGN
jgi:HSP90 family molecular chaperone